MKCVKSNDGQNVKCLFALVVYSFIYNYRETFVPFEMGVLDMLNNCMHGDVHYV